MQVCIRLMMVATTLLVFGGPVYANPERNAVQLTLQGATALALAQSPDSGLARNQEVAAQISLQKAQGAFLPNLQVSGNTAYQYDKQSGLGGSASHETSSLTIKSTVNIFNGFADSSSLASSQLQLSSQSAIVHRQLQTVVFETAKRFIKVLTQKELVLVEEENLVSQRLLLEQIGALHQAGSRSLTDLYRQQAEEAEAELILLQAQRNLEIANTELIQILALPPETKVEALQPEVEIFNTLDALDLEKLNIQALERRPDLKGQGLKVDVTGEEIKKAKSGYLPKIDLFVEAGSNYNGLDEELGFNDQFMEDNFSTVTGLSLTIPIFDRDQTKTSVALAQLDQADNSIKLAQLRQQISTEVGQALVNYQTIQKQLNVAETQLKYAHQALSATKERYDVGASTWTELSDSRSSFVQAKTNNINANYQMLEQALTVVFYRGDIEHFLSLAISQERQS